MTDPVPPSQGGPFTVVQRVGSYPAAVLAVARVVARNVPLRRVQMAYALFNSAEWATWVAMLVYAYDQGGATEAGIVATIQLVPAALCAPLAAGLGDRFAPGRALLFGYVAQAATCGVGGAALVIGLPKGAVYALLIPATFSFTLTRPIQSAFAPGLARSPDELTATNVVSGWIVGLSVCIAPAVGGVLLAVGSPGLVFLVMGGACAVGAALVAPLRDLVQAAAPDLEEHRRSMLVAGVRGAVHDRTTRLLVALLAAQGVLIGALDVLFVELAQGVLGRDGSWAGYLNAALGVGGVLAVLVTAGLVGRPRLALPLAISLGAASAALLGIATLPDVLGLVVLLALVGGSLSTLDVTARTLLQRAAPTDLLARVFGFVEGLEAVSLAVGSLLAGALVALGGASLAFAGLAAIMPILAAFSARRLLRIDRDATVPVVEITLLRSMSLFAPLSPPTLETLARSLEPLEVPAGGVVITQGDPGDRFYVIADGECEVIRDGEHVATHGRGAGFGEIALLRDRPRNATVRAVGPARLYALRKDSFINAVTGHPRAAQASDELVRARLEPGAA